MVCVILADGFEEMEAIAPIDLLRRAGVEVVTASIMESRRVTGGHGIFSEADALLSDISGTCEMVVLPGGLGCLENMQKSAALTEFLRAQDAAGAMLAAICAAPTHLSALGLLRGAHAVCYPDMKDALSDGKYCEDQSVVRDGRIITGEAAGSATEFALKLIEALRGWEASERVRKAIHFTSHTKGLD